MRNYRRLTGDGSVKVVLSGDSNSPPKTTSEREPPPYNSSPTQEVSSLVARPSRLPVPAPSRCHTLPPFCTTDHGQPATDKLKNVDLPADGSRKFQKKPVFARIRGLFSSGGGFRKVAFCPSESPSLRASVAKFDQSQNVESFPSLPALPSVQVLSRSRTSYPKFQKKPVSSRKFTFQHQPQTPLASDSVAKFDQSQNVESLPSLPCLPSVQVLSRSGTSHPKFQKKPVFAPPLFATTFREANVNPGQLIRGGLGKPNSRIVR
jgi:hypothetical protein